MSSRDIYHMSTWDIMCQLDIFLLLTGNRPPSDSRGSGEPWRSATPCSFQIRCTSLQLKIESSGFFFFLITLEPKVEWYKSLLACKSSPPRNRFTILRRSCSPIDNCTERYNSHFKNSREHRGGAPRRARSRSAEPPCGPGCRIQGVDRRIVLK